MPRTRKSQVTVLDPAFQQLQETEKRLAAIDAETGMRPYNLDAEVEILRTNMQHSALSLLRAGAAMTRIKEHEEEGNFYKVLDDLNINHRTARRLMQASYKYSHGSRQSLVNLGSTKMIELMVEDDEELDAFADGGTIYGMTLDDVDKMSVRELRKSLRKHRADAKEASEIHEQVLTTKNEKIDELDALLKRRENADTEQRARFLLQEMDETTFAVAGEMLKFSRAHRELQELYVDGVPDHFHDHAQRALSAHVDQLAELEDRFGQVDAGKGDWLKETGVVDA